VRAQQNYLSSDARAEPSNVSTEVSPQASSRNAQGNSQLPNAPRFTGDSNQLEPSAGRLDPFVQPASAIDTPRTIPHVGSRALSSIDQELPASSSETGADSSSATLVREPIALKPRSDSAGDGKGLGKPSSTAFGSTVTMFTSLLIVLALFLGLMLLLKKTRGAQSIELPREVFQVLGTSRLAGRHPLYLLRLGNKLVLVHASSGEVQSITEITDAEEVHRLCGSCEQNQPNSISESFRQVLKQVTDGKISSGGLADSRYRRSRSDSDQEEISPAVALLAKEKS
jgi:flagellar biogenesis protein FliO